MANKRAIHPNGDTIIFNERYHRYSSLLNPRIRFVSGTGFLKRFKPPFERDAIAARCAAKSASGETADEIIKGWELKGFIARTVGTLVHQFCEDSLAPGMEQPLIGAITHPNKEVQKAARIKAGVAIQVIERIKDEYEVVALEEIIASCDLGIAGMVDLRCVNKQSGAVALLDYKTSKSIDFQNQWRTMLPPLERFDDANFYHYALQLGLYEYIGLLEKYYTADQGVERLIIHIREDGFDFIPCPSMRNEISAMLLNAS